MTILHYIASFFSGLFFCNCIPHLASGLRGESFPTPFAKPRGIGLSSAGLNFLWGFFNLLIGIILWKLASVSVGFNLGFILLMIGFLLFGISLSRHFSAVKARRDDKQA
jgi:hypothetical protein